MSAKKPGFYVLLSSIIILSCFFVVRNGLNKIGSSSEYVNADRIIEKSIKDGFKSFFPNEAIVPKNSIVNYSMHQPLLGDDSYFLELECNYSVEIFREEQERIKKIFETIYTIDLDRVMYTTNHFKEDLTSLLDEEVLDGQTFHLEVVVFDESTLTVYYCLSLERDQNYTNYFCQILQELNKKGDGA